MEKETFAVESIADFPQVLSYWFDGDIQFNYKTKWFPSGSATLQSEADLLVNTLFSATLEAAMAKHLHHWLLKGHEAIVALIVILDQFSRHIFRFKNLENDSSERQLADTLALEVAEFLISMPEWSVNLSISQHVFALMPFRHNATEERLHNVLSSINARESLEMQNLELINRFRKQTMRRLQHLNDRSKAESSEEILERLPFIADETDILKNELSTATQKFLSKYISNNNDTINRNVAISLSGGVDSMVIAKILSALRKSPLLQISEIVAIHIDYANRPESSREADFVEDWCIQNGITFRKRLVNEVTRGITDRNEYERISRDIRYGFYKEVLKEFNCDGIMFGHHLGDIQENVISNVMRGCNPLQMSGMTEAGVSNGVAVWRPLLQYAKSSIYDFAHKYGVPYFKDSTPSWSTRGKLRTALIPLLVDMYGEGCLRNLTSLASESDEYRSLVEANVFEPFMKSVVRGPCGLMVNVLPFRSQPLCFWKESLKELMHSMSMSMVRDKAVHNFVERLQQQQHTGSGTCLVGGSLELRKGFHTVLYNNGDFVVLRDSVLGETATKNRVTNKKLGLTCYSNAELSIEDDLTKGRKDGNWEENMIFEILAIDNNTLTDETNVCAQINKSMTISTSPYSNMSSIPCSLNLIHRNSLDLLEEQTKKTLQFNEIVLGNWQIRISFHGEVIDAPDPRLTKDFKKFLTSKVGEQSNFIQNALGINGNTLERVSGLLCGEFHYYFAMPLDCANVIVWADYLSESQNKNKISSLTNIVENPGNGVKSVVEVMPVIPSCFSKLDNRLRLGLPLLVPATVVVSSQKQNNSGEDAQMASDALLPHGFKLFRADYEFITENSP